MRMLSLLRKMVQEAYRVPLVKLAMLLMVTPIFANLSKNVVEMNLILKVQSLNGQHTANLKLVKALAKWEGCWQWNNPTCLIFKHQRHARMGPRGFAVFSDTAMGWEAAIRDIERKRERGYRDIDIISIWCSCGNDTQRYIAKVWKELEKQ